MTKKLPPRKIISLPKIKPVPKRSVVVEREGQYSNGGPRRIKISIAKEPWV